MLSLANICFCPALGDPSLAPLSIPVNMPDASYARAARVLGITSFSYFELVSQGVWSKEEDNMLIELVAKHGKQWTKISAELNRFCECAAPPKQPKDQGINPPGLPPLIMGI